MSVYGINGIKRKDVQHMDNKDIDPKLKDELITAKRKSNGKNSPVIGDNGYLTNPGDNSKAIADMLYIYQMPPINIDSDEEVLARIQEYFSYCISKDIKLGVEGLAMALGVDRTTLWDWQTGRSRSGLSSSRSDIIKKAKQFLALYSENLAQNGKINPVTWIFQMKNHFGYKDVQEISVSATSPLGDIPSDAEMQKRIVQANPALIDSVDDF